MPGNEEHILLREKIKAAIYQLNENARALVSSLDPRNALRSIKLEFLAIEKPDEVRCAFAVGTTEDEYGQ